MMLLLGHEYFHPSARFRLSTGKLNQKMANGKHALEARDCVSLWRNLKISFPWRHLYTF